MFNKTGIRREGEHRIRTEFFRVFNYPQFEPSESILWQWHGKVTNTNLPRLIQLGL